MKLSKEDERFLKGLGQRIRALREERGWTLEQTEEHGWPNWRHLQKIESGKNITVITLKKISELYKVKPSAFFNLL